MKKRFFLCCVFILNLLLSGEAQAQDWQWGKNNNHPFWDLVEAAPTLVDYAGNVIVAGESSPGMGSISFGADTLFDAANSDEVFVVKLDPEGSFLWAVGTQNSSSYVLATATDSRGDIYVLGNFYDTSCTIGPYTLYNDTSIDDAMFFLVKIAPWGTVTWAKTICGGGEGAGAVCVDKTDHVYVTGSFTKPSVTIGSATFTNAQATGGTQDIFIAKYDSWGNFMWADHYGGTDDDFPVAMASAPDGTFYLAGYFASATMDIGSNTLTDSLHATTSLSGSGPYQYPFFAKIDTNDNVRWARIMNRHLQISVAEGMATDAFSNFYITGNIDSTVVFGMDTLLGAVPAQFVARYDTAGTGYWAKMVAKADGWAVAVDSCQHVWIGGSYDFPSWPVSFDGYSVPAPAGSVDPMFIAEYNDCGVFMNAEALPSGGDDEMGIAVDNLGDLYLGGDYYHSPMIFGTDTLYNFGDTVEAFFVAKYRYSFTPCTHDMPCALQVKGLAARADQDVQIYPNPVVKGGVLTIATVGQQPVAAELIDLSGRLLSHYDLSDPITAIALPLSANGLCFLKITLPNGEKIVRKILVEE